MIITDWFHLPFLQKGADTMLLKGKNLKLVNEENLSGLEYHQPH